MTEQTPIKKEKKVKAPVSVPSASAQASPAASAPVTSPSSPAPVSTSTTVTSESPSSPSTDKKAEQPKAQQAKVSKKDEAVARGISLPISKKHSMYICTFIKNKTVDKAIAELELVIKLKRAVPFKGEIPHRKGNIMSGRYPVNASKAFISVLKGLKGNIAVNGLSPDKAKIVQASASWASRPHQRGGARFKRTHIVITARESEAKK